MEPIAGTKAWYESDSTAIQNDPELAILIVQIGMAENALAAQFNAAKDATQRRGAIGLRDGLCSLVTSAALTCEALRVVQGGMKRLLPLARDGDASEDVLRQIGQLCAGKHQANSFLSRARNQFGFHWDEAAIGPSVREFGRNKKLVWMEGSIDDDDYVHRLAAEVLAHALVPASADERDRAITREMHHVFDAMKIVIQFCAASTFGFMRACGASTRATDQGGA